MAFSRVALGLFFILAGTAHFISPSPYLRIMPAYFPWPAVLVGLSGAAEILGGVGVCFRSTRRVAGWWLIALLVAVFPANIQAISTGMVMGEYVVPTWMLWLRLPVQLLLIAWVWRACLGRNSGRLKLALRSQREWKASHLRL
jgi:uncharacterized membrane protein